MLYSKFADQNMIINFFFTIFVLMIIVNFLQVCYYLLMINSYTELKVTEFLNIS